jgi:hypothetical protein
MGHLIFLLQDIHHLHRLQALKTVIQAQNQLDT